MYYVIAWQTDQRLTRRFWWVDYLWFDRRAIHVFALKWTGYEWVMVQPRIGYMEVQVLDYQRESDLPLIVEELEIDYTYQVGFERLDKYRYRTPWLLWVWTCTEQVKALLGIRAAWVFTPRQLHRYLKRRY